MSYGHRRFCTCPYRRSQLSGNTLKSDNFRDPKPELDDEVHTAVHIVCTGGQSVPRNRSLPSHLEIRPSGYFWRRRLPRISGPVSAASAAETGGPKTKPFLCLSLRTHLPADAKYLARRLTEMSDRIFAAGAGTAMTIALETRTRMLETLARFGIEAFERARAIANPRSPEAAMPELRREQAIQMTLRQALHLGEREVARNPLRHVAAQLGIVLEEADPDWKLLAYEATRVLLDVSQERARRQQGLYEQPTVYFRKALQPDPQPLAPASALLPDPLSAAFSSSVLPPAPQASGSCPAPGGMPEPRETASEPAIMHQLQPAPEPQAGALASAVPAQPPQEVDIIGATPAYRGPPAQDQRRQEAAVAGGPGGAGTAARDPARRGNRALLRAARPWLHERLCRRAEAQHRPRREMGKGERKQQAPRRNLLDRGAGRRDCRGDRTLRGR